MKLISCMVSLLISAIVSAQADGDYRTTSSGNWNTALWERYNGTVWIGPAAPPDNADGQINIRNGHTITVNNAPAIADQLIVDAGGSLVVNVGSGLTLADGTGDDLIIYGSVTISDGSFGPPGSVMVQPGGILLFNEPVASAVSGSLINNGTIEWRNGNLLFGAVTTITNNATFLITGNNALQNGISFSGSLVNNGTITKTSSGVTSFTLSGGVVNNGIINFNSGTISTTVTIDNTGDLVFNSGSFTTQFAFNYNAGAILGNGNFRNEGVLELAVDLELPAGIFFSTDNTNTVTGPGDFILNQDFTILGVFSGTGDLIINGNTTWDRGGIRRPFTVQAGRTLTIATPDGKVIGAPVINNGTTNWQDGDILFYANTAFTNNNILLISGNNEIRNGDSFGELVNNGTITKTSSGITSFSVSNGVNNSGIINLNAGTITTSFTMTNTGNLVFNSGAFIHQGTFNHEGGSITGSGTFTNSGVLNLNVDQEFPSTLIYAVDLNTTTTGAGDLILNQDFHVQGHITGTGVLVVHGNTLWTIRNITRNFTIEAGRTLTINTSDSKGLGGSFINNGVIDWQDGDIVFATSNAVFTNNATFTIAGNDEFTRGLFSGTIINNGTISKTGSGTTDFTVNFFNNNAGAVIRGSGTINMETANSFVNDGIIAPGLSPGLLTFNNRQPLSAASTLSIEMQDAGGPGAGHDQLIRNGSLTLSGTLTVSQTGSVPNGTYTIISLISGTISGSFHTVTLPIGYSLVVNANNVQLVKDLVSTPVRFISFTGKQQGHTVLLHWITENEVNNSHFEIERSSNGVLYETIGRVNAAASSVGRNEYDFPDLNPFTGTNFYRLKQVDLDGHVEYSSVVRIEIKDKSWIVVYPNPATDVIWVRVNNNISAKVDIAIYDQLGKLINKIQSVGRQVIQVPVQSLADGVYYLRVGDGSRVENGVFIKR